MRFSGKHALIVSTMSVAVAAWAAVTTFADDNHNAQPDKLITVNSHPAAGNDFTAAAESSIDGVVSIKSFASPRGNVYNNSPYSFDDPFLEFFFGSPRGNRQQPRQQQPQQQQQTGLGSGVIISSDGYIVTNNHVIANADRLEVTLNDGRSLNAEVIGTDEATDLALLKIEAEALSPIPMGDSDALKVGEWVLAVGNPFGLTSTVTAGIVSAKARSISSGQQRGQRMGIESYIQTDAAVNPGNSGGALVNLRGELVGINSAIYSQTGNYAGHSFAIPVSMVSKIASDLKKYGTVQRAVLGVSYTELDANTAREKGITKTNTGILVMEVVDRSAAKEAGIEPGDVIISINDTPTHTSAQMLEQMSLLSPGDKIKIKYIRDNKEHTVTATLYNAQGSTNISQAASVTQLGCAFKKISDETKKQLKISSGVQITGLKDGKFRAAGIKDGFIILDINNARVNSAEDVEKIFNAIVKSSDSDHVMFISGLYPTGKKMYYAVDLTD
ncbi:MAG: Do family serine endopeptidase [Paramuribaculum sp.]|nr:Do family serine endopeptidase [Paramuribaculum sp.]